MRAQTVAEYGLLLATVAVLALVGLVAFGAVIEPWFSHLVRVITR